MYEGGKIVIPKVTPEDKNQLTTWYPARQSRNQINH